MADEDIALTLLAEAAIAGLQLWFAYSREVGLTEEEKKALYDKVDADFMTKVKQDLPDA
ncbi:MAG: hypothetical protein ACYTKD_31510 [Planctomycetota bacterium]|jgi:hypothetical protein